MSKQGFPERFILFKGLFCQKWNREGQFCQELAVVNIQAALAYTFDGNGREFTPGKPCFAASRDLSWILGSDENPHVIRC